METKQHIDNLVGSMIHGEKVKFVLVERKVDVVKELYIGFTLDRHEKASVLIASQFGGVDIENVDEKHIYRKSVNPFIGIQPFMLRELVHSLNLTNKTEIAEISNIVKCLYKLFVKEDAELVEINPLAITKKPEILAVDAKLVINDDALYRHPEYLEFDKNLSPLEKRAEDMGIAFVELDGDIGIIANGAGLTMATLDCLNYYGGKPGIFLDLGGTDDPEKVRDAFVLMKDAKPKVIFLNIFGGITRCDTVAEGVKNALNSEKIDIPIVARIRGVHEDRARQILADAGLPASLSMDDAARETVRIAKGG
jgi:succinyl-CoA synthetase beta subunit